MEVVRHWRLQGQRYNLNGTICTNCGSKSFGPRLVCHVCSQPAQSHALRQKHTHEDSAVYELAARR